MSSSKIKILAIDDHPDNLISLKATIGDLFPNAQFIMAENGIIGLQLASQHNPDVILLDINMPVMDGFEVCRKIKSEPLLSDIPVVFVTAYASDKKNRIRALESGAEAFISKPIDEVELMAQITAMVKIKQATIAKLDEKVRLTSQVYERTRLLEQELNMRKSAEEKLQRISRHYQALFENAPDGIVLLNADGNFRYASPSARKMFGFTNSEDLTGNPANYTHPDDLPMVLFHLDRLFHEPSYRPVLQYRYSDKQGNWKWVESTFSNMLADQNVTSIVINFRDITDHKLAEKKLYENLTLLNMAGKLSKFGGWNVMLDEYCSYWSDEVAIIHEMPLGYSPPVEGGINFYAPEWREKITKVFNDCAQLGIPYDEEMEIITASGKRVWIRTMGEAVKDENGYIYKVQGAFQDISEQKQRIESLRLSDEKFVNFFENSIVGKSITEVTGKISVNNAFCKMLGYTKEELNNLNWQQITHPDDIQQDKANINSIISGAEVSKRWEKRYIRKDKEIVWVDLGTTLQRDQEGNPLYFITSVNDITERKNAEKALFESQEHYRKAQEVGHVGSWEYHIQKNTFWSSDEGKRVYGFDVNTEEFTAEEVMQLVHDRDRVNQAMIDLIEANKPYNIEFEITPRDSVVKKTINSIADLVRDEQGIPLLVRGVLLDITERKHAEVELKQQKLLLNTIIESATEAIFAKDVDGYYRSINKAGANIFGISQTEVLGKTDYDLVTKSTAHEFRKTDKYVMASGVKYEREETGMIDGKIRTFLAHKSPWVDSSGKIIGVIGISYDITDRKLAEEEIKKLNESLEMRVLHRTEQLEAANKELEAFTYSVSHDLRAPLRGIHGFTKILLEEYSDKLDNEGIRVCDIIKDNASKMGQLIDDLLTFSRLGRTNMQISKIDMKKMVESIYYEVTNEESRRRIDISIGNICSIVADTNLIRQVWINLLSNAVKFSSKREKADIKVSCINEYDKCVYCVKDNGAGFDMHYANKLFAVFQRLHSAKEYEGTGVGLAIVQRIVHRHGGQVWAEGEVDNGASFYFSLPENKE